ncbi:MAG: amino acid adenylation domain-containing protein [Thermoanaerobaculia bacterium]|nr:amino acid adenylation domain-containing protein [Thermoanaerobaculia bacterium]
MPLHKENVANILRLTPVQEGMLFECLYAGDQASDRAVYQDQIAFRTCGRLDLDAYGAAWNELVRRHESLRTSFVWEGAPHPLQLVLRDRPLELEIEDLSTFAGTNGEVELERSVTARRQALRHEPFDLKRDVLCRVNILRLAEDRFETVWTFHHIAFDGWSKAILLGELLEIYRSQAAGEPLTLAPARQHREYVRWLRTKDDEGSILWWRHELRGLGDGGHLTAQAIDDPRSSSTIEELRVSLPRGSADALNRLAANHRITPSTFVHALWGLVLAKITGSDDVVFGSIESGRDVPIDGAQGIVGVFINTIPVRQRFQLQQTFLQFLADAQERALERQAHSHVSLPRIQTVSGRSEPLFDHLLDVVNYPFDVEERLANSTVGFELERVTAVDESGYPLNLFVTLGTEVELAFSYDGAVFDRDRIVHLAEYAAELGELLLAAPETRLGALPSLSRREREALDRLRETWVSPTPRADALQARLSNHQERLWFIERFERGNVYPHSPTYHNLPLILHLRGRLDIDRLGRVLHSLEERHPALRLRIESRDGQVRQRVEPPSSKPLVVVDRAPPTAQNPRSRGTHLHSRNDLVELALEEVTQPIDMESEALWRRVLLRLGEDDHLLVLTIHHIVADRPSLQILASEIDRLYRTDSFPKGETFTPTFTDLAGSRLDSLPETDRLLLPYWQRRLGDGVAVLDLPTDRPRQAIHTFDVGRLTFQLEGDVVRGLDDLGAGRPGSLLAVFELVLHRSAGQDEIVVGTCVDTRDRPETESLVGPLANLLVLRNEMLPTSTGRQWIAHIDDTVREAVAHRDMPFDRLVAHLNPEKDMSRTALFDVLFLYEHDLPEPTDGNGLHIERLECAVGQGKYDLLLLCRPSAGGLECELVYNRDHFDSASVEVLARSFGDLAARLAQEPDRSIAELCRLDADEARAQLRAAEESVAVGYPRDETLCTMFERRAAERPDAIAVAFGATALSYGELNRSANRLARRLRARGLTPEDAVALLLDRGPDLVIAMLAVLKAGGCYVPIDPEYPQERVEYLIEASGAGIVLIEPGVKAVLDGLAVKTMTLGAHSTQSSDANTGNLRSGPAPGQAAYVIFTSGSTGRPKGVVVEHRHVLRLLTTDRPLFDFTTHDRWALVHSPSFDFSVWEIYGALLTGARLVIVPRPIVRDVDSLLAVLTFERVTILNQTPSAFTGLADREHTLPSLLELRYLIFGGEALKPVILASFARRYPSTRLINMYGITETTVHVTFKEIGGAEIAANLSNVGRPIPTLATLLLDRRGELVPQGTPAEICVAGAGVARGYTGQPGLTAQRFGPHPFADSERLYHSGDRAKLTDGDLIYCGRIDDQIKVRGFRIEPGEIEAALLEIEGVRQAAVRFDPEGDGGGSLIAHFAGDRSLSVELLRGSLLECLPEYMVPSRFLRHQALALTSSGKVDRRALAALEVEDLDLGSEFAAPRNAVEQTVAEAWGAVLGRDRVGIHDNYFALGGDSIKAIQVVSRLLEHDLGLGVQDLFLHPTVAELTPRLKRLARQRTDVPLEGPQPLAPIQRWFFRHFEHCPQHFNQALLFVHRVGFEANACQLAINGLFARHPALRTTFHKTRDGWIGRVEVELECVVEEVELEPDQDPLRALERHAHRTQGSLRLEEGPLFKAALFRHPRGDRLLFVGHHLVIDGTSWRILLDDFVAAYRQAVDGRPIALPPSTATYGSWAARLGELASSPSIRRQAEYWEAVEGHSVAISPDDPQGSNRYRDLEQISTELSKERTDLLRVKANAAYSTTAEDLLLTALARALEIWADAKSSVIVLERHGREDLGEQPSGLPVERTVGWFTTRFPFQLELPAGQDLGFQIKSIKEALRSVPDRGLGYGLLNAESSQPAAPLTSFNYLGDFDASMTVGDLIMVSEPVGDSVDGNSPRPTELDIGAAVLRGRLFLEIGYSRHRFSRHRTEALLVALRDSIGEVIDHCSGRLHPEVTPADLTYSGISLEELEGITS